MKTVIYLDELLLTNFLAAAALLLGAGLLCARQCSGLRLMAGSAAAAAASLGILLPELPGPAAFLYKVFTCCAAVAAAYGVPGLRNFVQLCAWYLLLNLLLCGAVLLPGVQSANLCVYLPLSPGRLLLCCGAVLAVLRGVLFCFGRAGTRCFAAVLELEGAALSVQAFCDTGFSVQDPLTGQAVVLVYYPAVRSALPQELRTFLDRYFACGTAPPPELRVRLVPCTTIAGHCVLPAEDMISIGTIGLIKAVNTFTPERSIKLATYASRCIGNEILMYLRKSSNRRQEASIDEPLNVDGDGNELLLSDILGSDENQISQRLEQDAERAVLRRAVDSLSPRERQIMELRFGLADGIERTQKEAADALGISQSYISRLEKRIIHTLKVQLENE